MYTFCKCKVGFIYLNTYPSTTDRGHSMGQRGESIIFGKAICDRSMEYKEWWRGKDFKVNKELLNLKPIIQDIHCRVLEFHLLAQIQEGWVGGSLRCQIQMGFVGSPALAQNQGWVAPLLAPLLAA